MDTDGQHVRASQRWPAGSTCRRHRNSRRKQHVTDTLPVARFKRRTPNPICPTHVAAIAS